MCSGHRCARPGTLVSGPESPVSLLALVAPRRQTAVHSTVKTTGTALLDVVPHPDELLPKGDLGAFHDGVTRLADVLGVLDVDVGQHDRLDVDHADGLLRDPGVGRGDRLFKRLEFGHLPRAEDALGRPRVVERLGYEVS